MTGVELQISDIGSNHSTNWATPTAQDIAKVVWDWLAGSNTLTFDDILLVLPKT